MSRAIPRPITGWVWAAANMAAIVLAASDAGPSPPAPMTPLPPGSEPMRSICTDASNHGSISRPLPAS